MKKTQPKRLRPRSGITFIEPSMAEQSHKDAVNVNKIMRRYTLTGILEHENRNSPRYNDNTACDYHDAMNRVAATNELFMQLPSAIRKKFDNDPANWLDYIQDPANPSLSKATKEHMSEANVSEAETPAPSPETEAID